MSHQMSYNHDDLIKKTVDTSDKINLENKNVGAEIKEHVTDNKIANPSKKKKRLGRASRRRRAKFRAIFQDNGQSIHSGVHSSEGPLEGNKDETAHSNSTNPIPLSLSSVLISPTTVSLSSLFPSDRSQTLPGVLQRRKDHLLNCLQKKEKSLVASRQEYEGTNVESNNIDHFNAQDRSMLTRQLGFIPGNAICVVAHRNSSIKHVLNDKQDSNEMLNESHIQQKQIQKSQNNEHPLEPIVLKLYPLAIRDCHDGGKSNERKFKSRKRGNIAKRKQRNERNKKNNEKIKVKQEQVDAADNSVEKVKVHDKEEAIDIDIEKDSNNEQQNHTKAKKQRRDWKTFDNNGIIEPFPTLFWLTCPRLRIQISRLENGKDCNVKQFELKLRNDPAALQSMKEAHLDYGKMRWDLLTDEDKEEIQRRGWQNSLGMERGVAGITRYDTIKCLHTHAAHYLSGETKNVVGKWVMHAVERLIHEDTISGNRMN